MQRTLQSIDLMEVGGCSRSCICNLQTLSFICKLFSTRDCYVLIAETNCTHLEKFNSQGVSATLTKERKEMPGTCGRKVPEKSGKMSGLRVICMI